MSKITHTLKKCTKITLYTFGGIMALGVLAQVFGDQEKTAKTSAEPATSGNEIAKYLTPTNREILKAFIAEDLAIGLNNGDSILPPPDLIRISAQALSKAFTSNELRANEKYKNKWALITGRVANVDVPTFGGYRVSMSEPMSLKQVVLNFDEDQKNNIINLNSGSRTSFVCKIRGGNTLGATSASDCTTFNEWTTRLVENTYNKFIDEATDGEFSEETTKNIVFASAVMGFYLENNKGKVCKKGINEKCINELSDLLAKTKGNYSPQEKEYFEKAAQVFGIKKDK